MDSLTKHRKLTKNLQYPQIKKHNYPLCSLTTFKKLQDLAHWGSRKPPTPWGTATRQLVAQHIYQPMVQHIFCPDGKKEIIDTVLQGSDRHIWTNSLSNEWERLAQGNKNNIRHTNTIKFIHKHDVPIGRDVTYATFVLDYCPLKDESH